MGCKSSSTKDIKTETNKSKQFEQAATTKTMSDSRKTDSSFLFNNLTIPTEISHIKAGHTLCVNEKLLVVQDGPTTLEIRLIGEFKAKRVPWNFGLIRDLIWSRELGLFFALTKTCLLSLNLEEFGRAKTLTSGSPPFDINLYTSVRPADEINSFWRLTSIDKFLYVSYTGYGTIIDQYQIKGRSSVFVRRWSPPETCLTHEGIWCIRHSRETNRFAFSILDATTNQWRFELRTTDKLTTLYKVSLPFFTGDCEVSPLINGDWLSTNSFNVRLIHISDGKLKAAVEYERELKNAVAIDQRFLVIRTKGTIDIHRLDQKK